MRFLVILAFLTMAVPSLYAQRGERGGGGRALFEELDLSSDQRAAISELRKANREEMRAHKRGANKMRKAIRQAKQDLREAMQGDATDEEIRAKFNSLQALEDNFHQQRKVLAELRFDQSLKIRKLLSPDQRREFRGFMKEHRKGAKGRGQGGFGH